MGGLVPLSNTVLLGTIPVSLAHGLSLCTSVTDIPTNTYRSSVASGSYAILPKNVTLRSDWGLWWWCWDDIAFYEMHSVFEGLDIVHQKVHGVIGAGFGLWPPVTRVGSSWNQLESSVWETVALTILLLLLNKFYYFCSFGLGCSS